VSKVLTGCLAFDDDVFVKKWEGKRDCWRSWNVEMILMGFVEWSGEIEGWFGGEKVLDMTDHAL
jgi:hypothetical protein